MLPSGTRLPCDTTSSHTPPYHQSALKFRSSSSPKPTVSIVCNSQRFATLQAQLQNHSPAPLLGFPGPWCRSFARTPRRSLSHTGAAVSALSHKLESYASPTATGTYTVHPSNSASIFLVVLLQASNDWIKCSRYVPLPRNNLCCGSSSSLLSQEAYVKGQVSSVKCQILSGKCPVLGVKCKVSRVKCKVSRVKS